MRGKSKNEINFEAINQSLLSQAGSILYQWLPGGVIHGNEFKCGDLSGSAGESLSINIKTGVWKDFATDEKGADLIDLYAAIKGLKLGDAARELSGSQVSTSVDTCEPAAQKPKLKDLPLIKPPNSERPPLEGCADYWWYGDKDGNNLFAVARYDKDGKKTFRPWSYRSDGKWVNKAWPEPRPLFGLDGFADPDTPILIVEGEKTCRAAQSIAGAVYAVVTWSNGASAVDKSDWTPLHGRKILIWPDADPAGKKAAARIAELLVNHCPEIKIIDPTDVEFEGWDAYDALTSSGWDWADFAAWAKPRAKLIERPVLAAVIPDSGITDDNHAEPQAEKQIIVPTTMPDVEVNFPSATYVQANLPHVNDKGRPRATIENFKAIMDMLGVHIRYNVIAKRQEIIIPQASFSIDNRNNAAYAWVLSWCNNVQMSVGQVKNFICYVADTNPYNPVAMWIQSKAWDGHSRLQDLFNTVTAKNESGDPTIKTLKEAMIKRWLVSAVAGVFRPDGVSAHGVLVFQGDQYLGKTAWFKRLAPASLEVIADGMLLRPDDKDSVKQICGYWLVELGELDATFKKSDIAQLKSFLTKQRDLLRPAFAPEECEYARRTVFFASVNPAQFLHDTTGNRRFWTIECESINYEHNIDMQQLWAEVTELWKAGESWFLTKAEMAMLNDHNESFMAVDPVEERIGSELDWDSETDKWKWKTVSQVLQEIKFDKPNQGDLNKASREITKRNGNQRKRGNGQRLLLVPKRVYTGMPLGLNGAHGPD